MAAAPDTGRGFISGNWRIIGLAALVGFIIGGLVATQVNSPFRSSVLVQIAEPALLSPIDGTTAAADEELRFAGSIVVGNEVRRTFPRADDASVRLVDDDTLEITMTANSATSAQRLAQAWAEAFITVRRQRLMTRYGELNDQLDVDLAAATEALGTARLADDEQAIALAEEQRNRVLDQRRIVDATVQGTRVDRGAIVVRDAPLPAERSGVGTVGLFALGATVGAVVAALGLTLREHRASRRTEDETWFDVGAAPVDDAIAAASAWPDDQAWADAGFGVAEAPLRVVEPQTLNGNHDRLLPAGNSLTDTGRAGGPGIAIADAPPDWADAISLISDG